MRRLFFHLLGLVAVVGLVSTRASATDARLELYGGVQLLVVVPEGWSFASERNDGGVVSARLADAREQLSLQLTFLPHTDGRLAGEDAQTQVMGNLVEPYLADSVEKHAQLQPLHARRAEGFYCVFTDAKLVGVRELPPNEYCHATVGLKVADGWFVVFTLFSQDTTSPDYRAALRLMQIGLRPAGEGRRDRQAF